MTAKDIFNGALGLADFVWFIIIGIVFILILLAWACCCICIKRAKRKGREEVLQQQRQQHAVHVPMPVPQNNPYYDNGHAASHMQLPVTAQQAANPTANYHRMGSPANASEESSNSGKTLRERIDALRERTSITSLNNPNEVGFEQASRQKYDSFKAPSDASGVSGPNPYDKRSDRVSEADSYADSYADSFDDRGSIMSATIPFDDKRDSSLGSVSDLSSPGPAAPKLLQGISEGQFDDVEPRSTIDSRVSDLDLERDSSIHSHFSVEF